MFRLRIQEVVAQQPHAAAAHLWFLLHCRGPVALRKASATTSASQPLFNAATHFLRSDFASLINCASAHAISSKYAALQDIVFVLRARCKVTCPPAESKFVKI